MIKNTANRPLSLKAETGSEKNNLQWKYSKGAEWKPVKKHPPVTSQEVLKMWAFQNCSTPGTTVYLSFSPIPDGNDNENYSSPASFFTAYCRLRWKSIFFFKSHQNIIKKNDNLFSAVLWIDSYPLKATSSHTQNFPFHCWTQRKQKYFTRRK